MKNSFVSFILLIVWIDFGNCDLKGHLEPLGQQRESEGHIEVREDVPDVITFHKDYVVGSKPVVFKGAGTNLPAFHLWTDEYMMEKFGDIPCDVEEGKKENRSQGMWKWNYKRFLEHYQTDDVYMVNSLRGKLLEDLRLLPSLSCGGFTKVISDVIMWFSSGGTKSVLHNDRIDNINCLFSGTKELYMVDKKFEEFIDFDAEEGAYSKVDVDAVDLDKYPGIAQAPWWKAKMQAGDCLFIPEGWFHQVRSHTDNKRNMAVNVWFHHLPLINQTECQQIDQEENFNAFRTYDGINIGKSIEGARFLLQLEVKDGPLSYKKFVRSVREHSDGLARKSVFKKVIPLLDKNKDKQITLEEVNALSDDEVRLASQLFPMFALEEEEEEDELFEEDPMLEKNENEDLPPVKSEISSGSKLKKEL
ncbi:bifunctional peptidase and (3S)-lysyl hydroxylase JMJD7-like [Clytia hemisphaerica]|uniref:JmjC domain-containing protein n=1 Tax=Clytia hemisphaerica TaxID=252671 RepID=A0A7M5X0C2_9CNID